MPLYPRTSLLLLLLALAWPVVAQSQAPAPASEAAPAAAPAPATALPPAQAQQMLDLLRDDKRRAEFTAMLEGMAKLAPAPAEPSQAAPAAVAVPPPASGPVLPLEPDSLTARVIDGAASALSSTGTQVVSAVRAVNDLPLLWRWISAQATDPQFRARVLDALWKMALAVGVGLLAEFALMRLFRRMRAGLGARAPATIDPVPLPPVMLTPGMPGVATPETDMPETGLAAAEAGETERQDPHHRLSLAMGTLRRLPFLIGRLLLDLVPIAAFAGVAIVLLRTQLGEPPLTRRAIELVVYGYVLCRVVLSITTMLISPATPRLRLLNVSDWAAAFLTRWVHRIMVLAVSGYVLAQIGLLFGMYQTAHDALMKLFAFFVHGCLIVAVLQARPYVAARLRAPSRMRGVWASLLDRFADVWHLVAIFYIAALWLVWAVELRNGYARLVQFCLITSAVLIGARLVAIVLLGGLDRTLRVNPDLAVRHPGLAERVALYQPMLRAAVVIALTVLTGLALLEAWNLGPVDWLLRNGLGGQVASAITVITITIVSAVLVWEGVNAAINRRLAKLTAEAHLVRAGRLRTLLPMARTTLLVVIVLVVALMVLSELGINIAPLLAGAGVIGIAVGFGSQKLVQDLITGLFLLFENAMQVGDVVTLGGLSGTVEALSIRTIRLRALDGSVHIVPFSAVTTVTNQTRDYGYAVLDISVGLNEAPGEVIPVVQDLAAEMRSDPKWAALILDQLDVMGVEKFIDTAWVLRVRMKTQPASRWSIGRELNRRVKLRFDELAIESPLTSHRALSALLTLPTAQETPA